MSNSDWAIQQLSNLLLLDNESLSQVLEYTAGLSNDDAAEHLKALLGESPKALEFISSYNARRAPQAFSTSLNPPTNASSNQSDEVPKSSRKTQKKKAPLHQLASRTIEGQGDVSGGYQKNGGEHRAPGQSTRNAGSSSTASDAFVLSDTPVARQQPKKTAGKLPPSAAGNLISDLPNVKTKTQINSHTSSRNASPAPKTKITVQGGVAAKGASSTLDDLDAAIRALEIQTNPSTSSSTNDTKSRTCTCNATRHPLLSAAPNCLNCGKIICVREGIGPCTFCSTTLLSSSQINSMLDSLKQERGSQRQLAHNATHRRAGIASSPSPSASPARHINNPSTLKTQKEGGGTGKGLEAAVAHRDKLLGFQKENVQRTTVHDEAADLADPGSVNRWADPAERARQFREQQKAMREQEERMRPEWEKRGRVLEIEVGKGGKVKPVLKMGVKKVEVGEAREDAGGEQNAIRNEGGKGVEKGGMLNQKVATIAAAQDEEEVADTEAANGHDGKGGTFARNPLLKAGMIRPIWEGGKGKGRVDHHQQQNGSTVRAERSGPTVMRGWKHLEDNESVILNGGAYEHDRRLGDEERAVGA